MAGINYYEVLELPKDATEAEVKRAYFKLVRKYSPEQDPEKFQQIREAYERLKDLSGEISVRLSIPDTALAKSMYETAEKAEKGKNYKAMSEICGEALGYFPDSTGFRYLLGHSLRMDGHSGKAVKALEPLYDSEPEEALFTKELALAYDERGYYKKALVLYQRTYELGIRTAGFLLDYSFCCDTNRQYEAGREILFTLLEEGKSSKKNEMSDLAQSLIEIYDMDSQCKQTMAERINAILQKNLSRLSSWFEGNFDYLEELMERMCDDFIQHCIQAKYAAFQSDIFEHVRNSFRNQESKEMLLELFQVITIIGLRNDTRFGEHMEIIAAAYCNEGDMFPEMEEKARKFSHLEARLLIIDEIPHIWEETAVIETDYPLLYEEIREFLEVLRQSKNIAYIKERLLKDYRRLYKHMSHTYYAERHPEEMGEGHLIYDGEQEAPYVRQGAKIGRNDPCPCGSGKKYKHCCGR